MWSKLRRLAALLLCLCLLLSLPALAEGTEDPEDPAAAEETPGPEEPEPAEGSDAAPARPVLRLGRGERHNAYIRGYEDGSVRPDAYVTLPEGAQMLYGLLQERPGDRAEVDGVEPGDWYYDAVCLLAAGGVLDPARDGPVLPKEALTRAQFVLMLTRLFPELEPRDCEYPDVPKGSPWYGAVGAAAAVGWVKGYEDGTFRPSAPITRAECTALINRALGRKADRALLDEQAVIPVFTDLNAGHWAYYELLEAAIGHSAAFAPEGETWSESDDAHLRYAPGPVLYGQDVYYAGEDGVILRDAAVGSLYFGPDGRYTSGNEEADGYAKSILAELYSPEMSREELLRAAYDYTRDSFKYLRRSESYDWGVTGWEVEEALTILRTGRGNCYCYAGVFWLLARQLGYDARAVSGGVGWSSRPHGWVDIEMDGVLCIFDTELEMAYRAKGTYIYDFFRMPYDSVPWPYTKAES